MLCRRQWLVASLALTAFGLGCADDKDAEAAKQVLDHYFGALRSRSFDAALSDYDDTFFSETTRADWRIGLASVVDKLGTFQSYEITSSGMTYKQVAGPGSYLRYFVAVTYSKHPSEEIFYLFQKQGGTKFKIVGHQIDAEGLNK